MPTVHHGTAASRRGVIDDRGGSEPGYLEDLAATDDHWWWVNRRRLICDLVTSLGVRGPIVDVGCGTGATIADLKARGHEAFGTDLSPIMLGINDLHGVVARSFIEALPFRDQGAGCVLALDVLEHLDDDVGAVVELGRILRRGSPLVLTVPAYPSLYGEFDRRAGHRRRYRAEQLARTVRDAGLDVLGSTYFNAALVAPAVLARRTPLRRFVSSNEDSSGGPLTSTVFNALATTERRILNRRRVPFGLSVLLVATAT